MSAKIIYKSYNQNESLLFPMSLGELIPENHPVRTVSAIIRLDILGIESTYKGGGTSSFHPRMLLKVIVYSYMCNVYSGRRMERLLHENVNYMWLSGMSRPDFRTINRFRSVRLCDGRFEELFRQTVVMMNEEGLVSLKVQYIDGSKIESVANKYTFVWKANGFRRQARVLLTGERGRMHRSRRPIEPEAVFGDIKFNHGFGRFRLKSNRKVRVEFGLVALAHNIRKYSAVLSERMMGRKPAYATV